MNNSNSQADWNQERLIAERAAQRLWLGYLVILIHGTIFICTLYANNFSLVWLKSLQIHRLFSEQIVFLTLILVMLLVLVVGGFYAGRVLLDQGVFYWLSQAHSVDELSNRLNRFEQWLKILKNTKSKTGKSAPERTMKDRYLGAFGLIKVQIICALIQLGISLLLLSRLINQI
jgi:hypothetical protein